MNSFNNSVNYDGYFSRIDQVLQMIKFNEAQMDIDNPYPYSEIFPVPTFFYLSADNKIFYN